jgi:hypothetical protein
MLYEEKGYHHNFSTSRTPQQNRVEERKNWSLQEITRTMLNEYDTPKCFLAKVVNTCCYILNRVTLRLELKRTPFEL